MLRFLLILNGLLQDPAALSPLAATPDTPAITVRVERRAERFDYHIDNPSNFEPGPLVPHFFEQRYDSANTWLLVNAEHKLFGGAASTEVGVTPRITTTGSDVDTFFQPTGDVITSGTRGNVRLRSFSIQQRIAMSSWRALTFGVTVGYRRSNMDFLPSDRIITHSLPPSEIREPVSGNETTWSHVVESGVTASLPVRLGSRWRLAVHLGALPITRSRLSISLPDKYPGQIIRADTFSFGARGRVAAEISLRRLSAGAALTLGGAWGYRQTAHYHERHSGGEMFVKVPLR